MSGDANILPEEHEKALALAADCAKLWPKMLAKADPEEQGEGGEGAEGGEDVSRSSVVGTG